MMLLRRSEGTPGWSMDGTAVRKAWGGGRGVFRGPLQPLHVAKSTSHVEDEAEHMQFRRFVV